MKTSVCSAASGLFVLLASGSAAAQVEVAQLETVLVEGRRAEPAEPADTPATAVRIDAETLAQTTNLINTEDALKYLPSLLVRKRFIGDTNAPVATRTTGINASARSLIFADGLLLSTLVNNNNGNGSPQWFLVPPGAIDHIDVLYGPYSAAYAGNSYGAVVDITTREPEQFEGQIKLNGAYQRFDQYGTDDAYPAYEFSASVGDRRGALSWRVGLSHLVSDSQPVIYQTIAQSTTAPADGEPVITGAFADRNRVGAPIQVLGAGNLTRTQQDSLSTRLVYSLTPALKLAYNGAIWINDATTRPDSYLSLADGSEYRGETAGSNGRVNIGGFSYAASALAPLFTNGLLEQQRLTQALTLTYGDPTWDWSVSVSDFQYLKDEQRVSAPSFGSNGYQASAGRIADAGDTGWRTADARIGWRPNGAHALGAGLHADQYELGSPVFDTREWASGARGAIFSDSRGKTRTLAAWLQDQWRFAPQWTATVGGRYERWKAFDGFNRNRSGSGGAFTYFDVDQPTVDRSGFSPKATVAWQTTPALELKASVGRALRFPTVGELYQNVATGTTFTQANPDLAPEDVLAAELSAHWQRGDNDLRATVFQETVKDLLVSQNAQIGPSQTFTTSFVQNLDKTRQRGVELVAARQNALITGLELNASATYVDAEILRNDAYVAPASTPDARSVGQRTPYVPKWRFTAMAVYRPDDRWALTLAGRHSTRQYATVDNSDVRADTYMGFDGYTVIDTRVSVQLDAHWQLAAGIDNLNNERYFLFHPFTQRTAFAEASYRF